MTACAEGTVGRRQWRHVGISWQLYALAVLPITLLVIFLYLPVYGNIIAFGSFIPARGIWGSP